MGSASTALNELIDPAAQLRCLASGFQFTEGPVWNPVEQALYFSDVAGDARWRWTQSTGAELVRQTTFKANGMAYDRDGGLLVCEHVTSCLVRFRPDGGVDRVAYHYKGKYLNSPNDVVVRASDNSIYFTDPDYGRWNDRIGQERTRELGFKGLYRVPPDGGEIELLVDEDEFDQPNGLCFSPDESLLYVNDTPRARVKVFDVEVDGSLSSGRVLLGEIGTGVIGEGIVDGMECDEHGNVWVTGPSGLWVIGPDGEHLGTIDTPEPAGSLAWGGKNLRTLFVATSSTLHAIETLVASPPLAFRANG